MEYFTIDREYRTELVIKKSKFISTFIPVQNQDEAVTNLNRIRKEFYDATHNCWAYKIFSYPNHLLQYSDDGEPARTAGLPIAKNIEGRDIFNVLLVVTRYFGGIKLGVGGLIKAYSDSAKQVIEKSVLIKMKEMDILAIEFDHQFTGNIMHIVKEYNLKIIEQLYSDKVNLKVLCEPLYTEKIKTVVINSTAGKVVAEFVKKDFIRV